MNEELLAEVERLLTLAVAARDRARAAEAECIRLRDEALRRLGQ